MKTTTSTTTTNRKQTTNNYCNTDLMCMMDFVSSHRYASTTPFMTTVGNHEAAPGNITNSSGTFTNVWGAAYAARFAMHSAASGGRDGLWFSFDMGPVCLIFFSSASFSFSSSFLIVALYHSSGARRVLVVRARLHSRQPAGRVAGG